MKNRPGNPGLKGRLLEKSIEAYIISLETINRLSVKYRIECFSHLICNAWELLLKAKILDDTKARKSIYYPRQKHDRPRTLALRDCLSKVFTNERDPVRSNLEHMADLRDEAMHLVISQVPPNVLGLFQACVLNYHRMLGVWFDISLSKRVPVGMMTLAYDFRPEEFDMGNALLRKRLGRESVEFLTEFQAKIHKEYEQLDKSSDFAIDIAYRLALVKKPGDADIVLTNGTSGSVTGVVEVPKDPGKTHPFRQKELILAINGALCGKTQINAYDIQCINKVYAVKKRPEFFYQGQVQGSPSQYSNAFLEWLTEQYQKDPEFFHKALRQARSSAPPR